ncbi:MAG: hypothetical protein FJ139_02035 [Deltaproteobacteria bacterium]|nr:hypothetical protein [Deltaproteobacteria bacterium]
MKFIVDANLGKLAKWLRILGYDTAYHRGTVDRDFLRKAEKEGRIVLTRVRSMSERQFSGRLVVIYSEHVRDQLREVVETLSLAVNPERVLSICLKCNESLEEIPREEVAGLVPDYVFASHPEMHICPRCKGVFWPGTHVQNVHNVLRTRILRHPP